MKRVIRLLPMLLILASASALAGWGGPGWGYGPYGWGGYPGYGYGPYSAAEPTGTTDVRAADDAFPGAGEDRPGFGQWGPSDAGNNQPGNGAPFSGPPGP